VMFYISNLVILYITPQPTSHAARCGGGSGVALCSF